MRGAAYGESWVGVIYRGFGLFDGGGRDEGSLGGGGMDVGGRFGNQTEGWAGLVPKRRESGWGGDGGCDLEQKKFVCVVRDQRVPGGCFSWC